MGIEPQEAAKTQRKKGKREEGRGTEAQRHRGAKGQRHRGKEGMKR